MPPSSKCREFAGLLNVAALLRFAGPNQRASRADHCLRRSLTLAIAALMAVGCSLTSASSEELVGGGDPNTVQVHGTGGHSGTGSAPSDGGVIATDAGGASGGGAGSETGGVTGLGGGGGAAAEGGSAGSGSTAGASGAPSDAGNVGVENCTNGIDDDFDSAVDCADPDCAAHGYQCAPTVPEGWQGPYVLYTGTDAAPNCPAEFPDRIAEGGVTATAPAASCPSCSCGSPQDAVCVAKFTKYYTAGWGCSGGSVKYVNKVLGASCTELASLPSDWPHRTRFSGHSVQATCAPKTSGNASVGKVQWAPNRALCGGASVGAGCGTKSACVPPAPAPYSAKVCVARDGDQACPSPFLLAFQLYTGVDDTRGCTACGCAVGGSCTANVSMDNNSSCSSPDPVTTATCHDGVWATSSPPVFTKPPSCNPLPSETNGRRQPQGPEDRVLPMNAR